jgi:hypothetical protein
MSENSLSVEKLKIEDDVIKDSSFDAVLISKSSDKLIANIPDSNSPIEDIAVNNDKESINQNLSLDESNNFENGELRLSQENDVLLDNHSLSNQFSIDISNKYISEREYKATQLHDDQDDKINTVYEQTSPINENKLDCNEDKHVKSSSRSLLNEISENDNKIIQGISEDINIDDEIDMLDDSQRSHENIDIIKSEPSIKNNSEQKPETDQLIDSNKTKLLKDNYINDELQNNDLLKSEKKEKSHVNTRIDISVNKDEAGNGEFEQIQINPNEVFFEKKETYKEQKSESKNLSTIQDSNFESDSQTKDLTSKIINQDNKVEVKVKSATKQKPLISKEQITDNDNFERGTLNAGTEEILELNFEKDYFRAPKIVCHEEKVTLDLPDQSSEKQNDQVIGYCNSGNLGTHSGNNVTESNSIENPSGDTLSFQVDKDFFKAPKVVCRDSSENETNKESDNITETPLKGFSRPNDIEVKLKENNHDVEVNPKMNLLIEHAENLMNQQMDSGLNYQHSEIGELSKTPNKRHKDNSNERHGFSESPSRSKINNQNEVNDKTTIEKINEGSNENFMSTPKKAKNDNLKINHNDINEFSESKKVEMKDIESKKGQLNTSGKKSTMDHLKNIQSDTKKPDVINKTLDKNTVKEQTPKNKVPTLKIVPDLSQEELIDYIDPCNLSSDSCYSLTLNIVAKDGSYEIVKSDGQVIKGVRQDDEDTEGDFLRSQSSSFVYEYIKIFPDVRKKSYYKKSIRDRIQNWRQNEKTPKVSNSEIDHAQDQNNKFIKNNETLETNLSKISPTKNLEMSTGIDAVKTDSVTDELMADVIVNAKRSPNLKEPNVKSDILNEDLDQFNDFSIKNHSKSFKKETLKKQNKINEEPLPKEEQTLNQSDDIFATTSNVDDKPIKISKGNYDLDNLDSLKDTYVPSAKALALKAKRDAMKNAQSAASKTKLESKDEIQPSTLHSNSEVPEKRESTKTILVKQRIDTESVMIKKPVDNDDLPLKSASGGYNLDNLDSIQDTYVPSAKASKMKAQPKTVAKPINESNRINEGLSESVDDPKINNPQNLSKGVEIPSAKVVASNDLEQGVDPDSTLEGRMKSDKINIRVQAYKDILIWEDDTITPSFFCKNLHLQIKEKNLQILEIILSVIENILQNSPEACSSLDKKKFIVAFVEFCLSNAKNELLAKALGLVKNIFAIYPKEEFLNLVKEEMLKKSKPKLQENALVIILQLLKDGLGPEISFIKNIKDELESFTASRTLAIKNLSFEIYKETFLWMEEGVKVWMNTLKKPVFDELDAIFKTIDKSQMKNVSKEPGAKKKVVDAYDLSDEVELPKKFTEDAWTEEVLAIAKWSEKKEKLDELNNFILKNPRISPKTNVLHFINFGRRLLGDSNAVVQATTAKMLGLLANSVRKPFYQVAKSLFSNLVTKLKEKNRIVNDELLFGCEKFMSLLTFDEISEEFKDHIKDKGVEKKINILKLILVMIEKIDKIKTDVQAVKIAKMLLFLLDDNEKIVRDTASLVIAKLKDNWNQKITVLLSDLNSQKLSKIQSLCKEVVEVESNADYDNEYSVAPQQKTPIILSSTLPDIKATMTKNSIVIPTETMAPIDKKSARKAPVSIGKDKRQMIREIKETIFSNRTVRISDVKTFTNYLYTQLKIVSDFTKDFKEINSSEVSEFTMLLLEISQKVEKAAFHEDSKKIIVDFIFEQLQNRSNEEANREIESFIFSSANKIYSSKIFLQDINEVLIQRKTKPTKELIQFILGVIEKEALAANTVASVSMKQFNDFLKTHFYNQVSHQNTKTLIMSTLKTLTKKFGDKVLSDIPANITKELEMSVIESQKSLSKMMEKLLDKSHDKKRVALTELSQMDDVSKINIYWNNNDFVAILKRNIIIEYKSPLYSTILMILDNYLLVKKNSPFEFNSKNYIFVFQAVLTIFQDNKQNEINEEANSLIENTVEAYTATGLLYEMIALPNSINSKDQIMQFYLDYSIFNLIPEATNTELGSSEAVSAEVIDVDPNSKADLNSYKFISVDVRFMDYIISILSLKNLSSETNSLLINCLTMLKDCKDHEVFLRGNEIKVIREIWQKSEEEILLNNNFIKGYKYLDDQATRTKTINFLMKHLKLKSINELFCSKFTAFDYNSSKPLRGLLTFYLLRSAENHQVLQIFIYHQLVLMEKDLFGKSEKSEKTTDLNELNCLLICKVLFVLLKNLAWNRGVKLFNEISDFLNKIKKKGNFSNKDLVTKLDLNSEEQLFLESLFGNVPNETPPTPNRLPAKTNVVNKIDHYNAPTNVSMNISSSNPKEKLTNKKTSNVTAKSQRIDSEMNYNTNKNDESMYNAPQSNFDTSTNMIIPSLGINELLSKIALDEVIDKMMTFNLDLFQDACDYFQKILEPITYEALEFIVHNVDYIAETFIDVCKCVFENGIYYEISKECYELIFIPLQLLCQQAEFISSMSNEVLALFVEIVLEKLVMSNEEKTLLSKDKSAEATHVELAAFLVKVWNSIMLRIIEFSDSNNLLTILVQIVINASSMENLKLAESIQSIAFKCIIRITRNLDKFIEKIDLRVIFGLFYNFVNIFGENETIGYKTLSTLLREIVSLLDPDFIHEAYAETFNGQYEEFVSRVIGIEPPENDFENEIESELFRLIKDFNKITRPNQVTAYIDSFIQLMDQATWINLADYEAEFININFYNTLIQQISLKLRKSNPKSTKTRGVAAPASTASSGQRGSGRYDTSSKTSNPRTK